MTEETKKIAVLETGGKIIANFSDPDKFERMWRLAGMLARSDFAPPPYKGKAENCLIAVELALRIGCGPFEILQNSTVVHGKPTMSSKWLHARLVNSGLVAHVSLRWTGEKETLACRAVVETRDGKEVVGPEISVKLAKQRGWISRKGSWWQDAPELMMGYRAVSWLVNSHFPQVAAGMIDTETARDIGPSVESRSPYENTDWRDIPEDAEPSPEDASPPARENVGPTVARLDPGAAVAVWQDAYDAESERRKHGPEGNDTDDRAAGQDSISKMELE